MAKEDGRRERTRVDFNRIIRNIWGEPYRTTMSVPLRLGKVAVDAIEAASTSRGSALESDEKLRLMDLARKIVNCKLAGSVEDTPFNVLILPKRVIDILDRHISNAGFVAGVYSACNAMLYGDEATTPSFDDIDVEEAGEIEQDTPTAWKPQVQSA